MNYRLAEILAAEDLGAKGTKTLDLNFSEIASRLRLRYNFTNGTPLLNVKHPVECLTQIELVDGSDVLFSLTGAQAQALSFYDTGVTPLNIFDVDTGSKQYTQVDINFGRFLWDTELGFDPSRFNNAQLKVTFDEDAANASASAGTLEVLGFLFDEKAASPSGFLMNKEHYSYTPAASEHKYIDLPSDYVLRNMLLRTLITDGDPVDQIESIKLSENNDKRIPYDISMLDLALWNMELYGGLNEYCQNDLVVTETYWNATPAYRLQVTPVSVGNPTTTEAELPAITIANNKITLGATTHTTRDKTHIKGYAPHNVFAFPLGNPFEIADWYDIAAIKSLRLDIETTSNDQTGGEVNVILQQLRPY